MTRPLRLVVATALLACAAVAATAQVWAPIARVSSTLGNDARRICIGGTADFHGCPAHAPYVSSSGLVGIGTSHPNAHLDVHGTVSATYLRLSSPTTVVGCNAGLTGSMRYTSGTMQVCDGTAWGNIGIGVPAGTISAFAAASCPSGWVEYGPARGRFLRGIDNGAGNDPDGTRAPGNVQADMLAAHTHGLPGSLLHNSAPADFSSQGGGSADYRRNENTGHTTTSSGGTETRPKNVAVIFCSYAGYQSEVVPGISTLGGLSDVSIGGASTGQVLAFDGATWVASNTTATSNALGDRIISGTHAVTVNTASGVVSLSAAGTTWGYLSSGNSYLPTVVANKVSATNVSASVLQLGAGGSCGVLGDAGKIRWNGSAIEYCNGSEWIGVSNGVSTELSLLMHMDGNNGGTAFADSSNWAHASSVHGQTNTSSAQSKFGGTSAYFDGNGDYLSIPASNAFAFGTGDFTIDFWYRPQSTGLYATPMGTWGVGVNTGDWRFYHVNASNMKWDVYAAGGCAESIDFSIINAAWNHIAVTRSGTTMRVFVNGTLGGSTTSTCNIGTTQPLRIGGAYVTSMAYIEGYIDELRIIKGSAMWTANFTPPAVPYGASSSAGDNLGNHLASQPLNMGGFDISNTGLVSAAAVSASTISATLIQAGVSTAVCNAGLAGGIRYNAVSNTLQVCTGTTGWKSVTSGTAVSSLDALTDVNITSLAGRDYLRYDHATSRWVNISESTVMSTTTMVPAFPDAIRCNSATNNIFLFLSNITVASNVRTYIYPGSATLTVNYNPNGTYNSQTNMAAWDCVSSTKSIATLYAEGNAFNFIGNSGANDSRGDRLVSGTLPHAVTVNSATGVVSLSSGVTTWGYLGSANSYLPLVSSARVSSTNISATTIHAAGNVQAFSFLHPSDERLKADITSIPNAAAILESLRGTHFTWKSNGKFSYGLIAQEIEKVMPSAVEGTDSKVVDYNQFIAVLVEGWKTHHKAIASLKADNDHLEQRVQNFELTNDGLRRWNLQLREELETVKADNDNLRSEFSALRGEVQQLRQANAP